MCTFGCRCNQADSAALGAALERRSMVETRSHRDAEWIVVNTCTVTHRADQQARQAVRRFRRGNPAARIAVTGCYAQRDPRALAALPGVDIVAGNADKERLADLIAEAAGAGGAAVYCSALSEARDFAPAGPGAGAGRTRPCLKIQDGCDGRCSYCIVPQVRGPERSARPGEVLRLLGDLVERGYREIVLAGINLGRYGRGLDEPVTLADLLERALALPGLGRIRLSSIEPMHFDRALVRLAAGNPAAARHFHIPLQSGSERILRHMRRPYGAADFRELLCRIADVIPEAGLGTDVMVGFPGESREDFEATCSLVAELPLSYLHVFPFSARPGTEAAGMGAPVPAAAVQERVAVLRQLSREKNLAFRRRMIGRTLPAITLAGQQREGSTEVLTDNYIRARVPGVRLPSNRLVSVRIVEAFPESTTALLCGDARE